MVRDRYLMCLLVMATFLTLSYHVRVVKGARGAQARNAGLASGEPGEPVVQGDRLPKLLTS